MRRLLSAVVLLASPVQVSAADGNRLTYLDECNPYYVGRNFPRLITPQWVGEEGVECVVVLSIDDMREPKKYEDVLRPILNRLKKIDGRAPLSIMTCNVDPQHPQLQTWLKEGLSLETHTVDHPCPLLGGDFKKAVSTYERCVDIMTAVPNSKPVAFRTPCCDSLNTLSPRFFAEIFPKTTAKGNFLTIDSSVFNVFTANDPALPRELVLDADGTEKFRKYIPADRPFGNTIEDYPYPYVINRTCWEIPCVMPTDWDAQHLHKPNNPVTVRDWKAALDATVIKQGVFCLVFHPHGWIKPEQVVELIDHAVEKHGKKVKFLNFKEVQERLDKNVLDGQSLRAADGSDNGVRLLDVNNDGFMDVVVGNDKKQQTRLWLPRTGAWAELPFPTRLVTKTGGRDNGARFGVIRPDGRASLLVQNGDLAGSWHFTGTEWLDDPSLRAGLTNVLTQRGAQLRDLDGDGCCELIVANDKESAVYGWSAETKSWGKLPFHLPPGVTLPGPERQDTGVRFVDIDEDGHPDLLVSNEKGYGVYLFANMKDGWSRKVLEGKPGDKSALPLIASNGENLGAWFYARALWVQNEHTAIQKHLVELRSYNQLLAQAEPTAKSPEASLRSMKARAGFEIELVVSEPLVQSPIYMAWGPDGKLWVVEMGDYPLGLDGKGKPGGKVKVLEDTKGTGKYDKATVFLDHLSFPTSVLPWKKGVIVTCAPEIFYAEDTTGTGKADKKVVLYSGFREGNPQHRVNSLAWGLDNWLYCANGDSGGTVKSLKTGTAVTMSGRDLRIRPDTGTLDLQAGQTQYIRSRDDWNNWFGNNNSWPMYHYALADQYIRRNPHLAAPDPRVQVSEVPGASRVYPISRTLPRFNDPGAANHFTSACSAIVYRDELFGPMFSSSTFVSEPVHNLVHREIIAPNGCTFTSKRAPDEQTAEFLASSDNWFRPTMITTGPDGALWIADMYRAVIEHPEWIPKDWQQKLDLRAGQDKGRIYRVYPTGAKLRAIPRLDKLDAAGLVAALDSPNGWQRDLAHMMLVWRFTDQEPDAQARAKVTALLEKMALASDRPLARVHALCTLDGINALTPALVQKALADKHPGVRQHTIRLSEPFVNKSPELGPALLNLVDDAELPVRLQLAYTLGEWDDPRAGEALGRLAVKNSGDRFITAAVMSSVNKKNLDAVLLAVMSADPKGPPPAVLLENLLRLANALNHSKALVKLLAAVAAPDKGAFAPWQFAALAGLLDTLDQRNTSLKQLHADGDAEVKKAVEQTSGLFQAARTLLTDKQARREDQLAALRLLGRGLDNQKEDLDRLAGLLVPQTAVELQTAAVAALGRLREPRVAQLLVRGWKGYGPGVRAGVLEVLFRRDDWLRATLDALEKKEIPPGELDAVRRQRLVEHKDPEVRCRAATLFAGAFAPDRQKIIDDYQPVVKLTGDPMRGSQVFAKHCATCHKLGNMGHEVGPDLASVGDKSPQGLLISILDPNRVVEAKYVNYTALTKNGQSFTGVLASETGNSVTLLMPEGKQQVILRNDLDELVSTGKSPMPEGLEKEIPHQDMADLIAFVRGAVPLAKPKTFAGNKPETVKPDKDGVLLLSAANGEIYGSSLVLEKKYGNLGFWTSDDDHVVWSLDVPRAGKYAVWLDWACADSSAGKPFLVSGGASDVTGKVEGTGDWDHYKQAKVGEIVLTAGAQRLTFKPGRKLSSSAFIDLKSVKLVPVKE
jgi:putative membrane-bound dehydrogenase-like protein